MAKRLVRSWDVFDTLISRRCGPPENIFYLMEDVLGIGFKTARMQAEYDARASKDEISIDDIYDHVQVALAWTHEERQLALELEIRTEYANIIPILENLSRVRDGDIVVSDMYLDLEIIGGLLRAAGLRKKVKLFVSNNGKADGKMWKRLRKDFYILRHTGDNARSDFLRPLRHGIPACITEVSTETSWERFLRCNGAPALSAFVREMRLGTEHESREMRAVQRAQIETNFPLLLLASAALVHWCTEHGISRALMCSRDCILWTPLADKLARHARCELVVEYFLTSRVTALMPSENFLNYAAKRITTDSVVVDLSMTGVSLAGLADRLGLKEVRAFVISSQRSSSSSLYGESFLARTKVIIESLTAEVIDEDLEAINQAPYASIHDVHETDAGLKLTHAPESRSRPVLDAVSVQGAAFSKMLNRVPESVMSEALTLAKGTRLVFLIRECARHSGSFNTVISRARPGAALWNDPNGIKLKLPYATQTPWVRRSGCVVKFFLKPMAPPGSPLHRASKNSLRIFKALKKAIYK